MRINELINNSNKLKELYIQYVKKKSIIREDRSFSLVNAHVVKSKHNINFVTFLLNKKIFFDWMIIGLYYAVYHICLALVCNKGFISKNHNSTLCFILMHYSDFNNKEIEFINELSISKEDAEFYSELKSERRKASYSTKFDKDEQYIKELLIKSKDFINKVKIILE